MFAPTTRSWSRPRRWCIQHRDRSNSSKSWMHQHENDIYRRMSRYDNYRARSAYKLIQIDDKYKFLRPGLVVLEAGAAPGSWTQVISQRLELDSDNLSAKAKSGMCIAIDIAAIRPVKGAICIGNADITSPFSQGRLLTWLDDRLVDCVLSDMSPNCTGQKYYNHTKIMELVKNLLTFSLQILRPNTGLFLAKIFDGNETEQLVETLESHFEKVNRVKPPASQGDSTESYVLARNYRGK